MPFIPQFGPRENLIKNIQVCFSEFGFLSERKFWKTKTKNVEHKLKKNVHKPVIRGPNHLLYLLQPAARFTCEQKLIVIN